MMKRGLLSALMVFVAVLQLQGAIKLTALGSMDRIFQHETILGSEFAEIFAARNEVESFQVVVGAADSNLVVNSVVLQELVSDDGNKIADDNIRLYRQEYVRVRKSTLHAELPPGLYPDPLVPFINPESGKPVLPCTRVRDKKTRKVSYIGADISPLPFIVWAGQNQPLWVDVHVPADAKPGVYQGSVVVDSDHGSAEIPVKLTVWGFTLPASPSMRNHLASSFKPLAKMYGVKPGSPEFQAIEKRYCLLMREHRLSPPVPGYLLPAMQADGSLKITPDAHAALKQYRDEMNLVDFKIPRYKFSPDNEAQVNKAKRYYAQYQRYLVDNGWIDRAYVYMLDEPNTLEDYAAVVGIGKVIHEVAPGIKCLVTEQTFPQRAGWPDIDPGVDIWCPLFAYIDRNTVNQKIAQGDEVWSYTALAQRSSPHHPDYQNVQGKFPPFWHIDRPLLVYRVPVWINRQYNITGLLYWGSLIASQENPWYAPALMRDFHFNGSGFMVYPGTPCNFQGPVASTRLKNLRDGMEDYEYLVLLEKKAGLEATMKFVNRIAPTWWEYARDPQLILQVRKELAAAIMAD